MSELNIRLQQAVQLHQNGQLDQAAAIYRQVLQLQPEHADALHLLGLIEHHRGRSLEAVQLISRAIDLAGERPHYLTNLAAALMAQGNAADAVIHLEKVLELQPNFSDAHYIYAKALLLLGSVERSVKHYQRVLELQPDHPLVHHDLGQAHQQMGDFPGAISHMEKFTMAQPNNAEAIYNLALAYSIEGRSESAMQCYCRGLMIKQIDEQQRGYFFANLCLHKVNIIPQPLVDEIERSLDLEGVDRDELASLIATVLLQRPYIQSVFRQVRDGDVTAIKEVWDNSDLISLLNDTLLLKVLQLAILRDHKLEVLLSALRKLILLCFAKEHGPVREDVAGGALPSFIKSLAMQCFNNEYVYFVSNEEAQLCELLAHELECLSKDERLESSVYQMKLGLLAMYQPLITLKFQADLPASSNKIWRQSMIPVVRQQLDEPGMEQALLKSIPCVTPEPHTDSDEYKAEYDQFPYPRWLSVRYHSPRPLREYIKELLKHDNKNAVLPKSRRILVAGCGTGREVISLASQLDDVEILAIDFSPRSVAYARRMAEKLGFESIEFRVGDILELHRLQERFAMVVCSGVLHHMQDPLAGWRILSGLLEPGGWMNIGLYSDQGRHEIQEIQQRLGTNRGVTDETRIRQTRHDIIQSLLGNAEAPADFAVQRVASYRDFYSMSQCRYLLFGIPEHLFSIAEIANALEEMGLVFRGFSRLTTATIERYQSRYPDDHARFNLDYWQEFESEYPQTFSEMYSFWCRRNN